MAANNINVAALIDRIAAYTGRNIVNEQINLQSQLIDKKVLTKYNALGEVPNIFLSGGAMRSTRMLQNVGNSVAKLPSGSNNGYFELKPAPCQLFCNILIPKGSQLLLTGAKQAINLITNQIEQGSTDMVWQLGRYLFDGNLATNTAAVAFDTTVGNDTTVAVNDISGFRNGQTVDIYFGATAGVGGTPTATAEVASVTSPVDAGTGSVTLTLTAKISGMAATSNAIGTLRLTMAGFNSQIDVSAGTSAAVFTDNTYDFVGLNDATGTGDLYNTTVPAKFQYVGNVKSNTGAISITSINRFLAQIRTRAGKHKIDFIVWNPQVAAEYGNLNVEFRRYTDGKSDVLKQALTTPTFAGIPIVEDENCPISKAFFVNKGAVQLAVWGEIEPERGVDGKTQVLQSENAYGFFMNGYYQSWVNRRNCNGQMAGITISS